MEGTYAAAYADLYRRHWWWRVREKILLRKVKQVLTGRPSARILDVGCGAGLFFDMLEPLGHIEGIESDDVAVEQSGRWRDRIHVGEIATFKSDEGYDLILMLDVLEHVEHPAVVLRQAIEWLKPHGAMLITVPAFDWLWTAHDDLNHHVKRYSAAELRGLVRGAGLHVEETRYLFQSLVVPKMFVRVKEALTMCSASVPRVPHRVLNTTLRTWFQLESAVAGWLPFGSSILLIAKKHAR